MEDLLENRTVLITGGAGCIGSNLVRRLLASPVRHIVVLDDLSASPRWNLPETDKLTFIQASVLDEEALKYAFSFRPEIVLHLAALFANQNSVEHPEQDLMVNGLGMLKVLEYSYLAKVERFVFASSGCSVYGSQAPLPLVEDFTSLDLDTPYQITKLLGEVYCNFFTNFYEMAIVRARFFNVYGPGEVPGRYRNVIPNFIYWVSHGQPVPITGTGDETRDFTFVGDIVDGLIRCLAVPEAVGEAINLASGYETSVRQILEHVQRAVGTDTEAVQVGRRRWDRITRRYASIDKAKRLLGYNPQTPIAEGIREAVEWFRANQENIEREIKSRGGLPSPALAVRDAAGVGA
jgi:UDP-glucose 4-epimerase